MLKNRKKEIEDGSFSISISEFAELAKMAMETEIHRLIDEALQSSTKLTLSHSYSRTSHQR